jgi:drug/metabolite transporter (DMT)-like permease
LCSSSLFSGGVLLYLISVPVEGFYAGPFPAEYYIALGWLGFLSAAAFTIWYKLLQRPGVKVSELNFWKFLIPVSGAFLSWIFIKGEKPEWVSIFGMAFIAGALVLLNVNTKGRDKKA